MKTFKLISKIIFLFLMIFVLFFMILALSPKVKGYVASKKMERKNNIVLSKHYVVVKKMEQPIIMDFCQDNKYLPEVEYIGKIDIGNNGEMVYRYPGIFNDYYINNKLYISFHQEKFTRRKIYFNKPVEDKYSYIEKYGSCYIKKEDVIPGTPRYHELFADYLEEDNNRLDKEYAYKEIDYSVGEKYLKHWWKKERIKNELLNAIKLDPGECFVMENGDILRCNEEKDDTVCYTPGCYEY